jgi:hypothetical protein
MTPGDVSANDDIVQKSANGDRHRQSLSDLADSPREKAPEGPEYYLILLGEDGAGEGIRTLDPNLGKVVLYP